LRATQTKQGFAHGVKFRQAKFQANTKHQENNTEFSKVTARLSIRQYRKGIGAKQYTHHEIRQHWRQAHGAEKRHRQDRACEYKQYTGK